MLKIRKKTRGIPVIFLTAAFKTEEFQQKGYEVGAVDYLLKPIDDNLLINKISTYFRLIQKEREMNLVLEQKVGGIDVPIVHNVSVMNVRIVGEKAAVDCEIHVHSPIKAFIRSVYKGPSPKFDSPWYQIAPRSAKGHTG